MALMNSYAHYGDNFEIDCPTGSGKQQMNLFDVSKEIADRLIRILTRDEHVGGPSTAAAKFQANP
jgi:hypothetical protein